MPRRIVIACVTAVLSLLAIVAVVSVYRAWLPRYRLGRIKYDCEEHNCVNGDLLVKYFLECGDRCVPPLVDDVEGNAISSYFPWPQDLLQNFPDATRKEIISRLQSYREPPRNEEGGEIFLVGKFLQRRSNLIYCLIYVADDWSYLDDWISDAQRPERREWSDEGSVREMSDHVGTKLRRFDAPPLVNMPRALGDWSLNPDFVEWWKVHKADVIAASGEPD